MVEEQPRDRAIVTEARQFAHAKFNGRVAKAKELIRRLADTIEQQAHREVQWHSGLSKAGRTILDLTARANRAEAALESSQSPSPVSEKQSANGVISIKAELERARNYMADAKDMVGTPAGTRASCCDALGCIERAEYALSAQPPVWTPTDEQGAMVREALTKAAGWFRDYQRQHKAKGTSEGDVKAATNAARAIMCESVLLALNPLSKGNADA
jgi:hypothetical protein